MPDHLPQHGCDVPGGDLEYVVVCAGSVGDLLRERQLVRMVGAEVEREGRRWWFAPFASDGGGDRHDDGGIEPTGEERGHRLTFGHTGVDGIVDRCPDDWDPGGFRAWAGLDVFVDEPAHDLSLERGEIDLQPVAGRQLAEVQERAALSGDEAEGQELPDRPGIEPPREPRHGEDGLGLDTDDDPPAVASPVDGPDSGRIPHDDESVLVHDGDDPLSLEGLDRSELLTAIVGKDIADFDAIFQPTGDGQRHRSVSVDGQSTQATIWVRQRHPDGCRVATATPAPASAPRWPR